MARPRGKFLLQGRMTDGAQTSLRRAIESQHGGRATFLQSVPIFLAAKGKPDWNGAVQVFDLAESPSGALRVYAWSAGLPDGQRRVYTAVHAGAVTGPREAVRAALGHAK
jgi:hypothetical protein